MIRGMDRSTDETEQDQRIEVQYMSVLLEVQCPISSVEFHHVVRNINGQWAMGIGE